MRFIINSYDSVQAFEFFKTQEAELIFHDNDLFFLEYGDLQKYLAKEDSELSISLE